MDDMEIELPGKHGMSLRRLAAEIACAVNRANPFGRRYASPVTQRVLVR